MIFFIHSLFFLNSSGLSNIYSLLVPFLYKSRTIGSIGFSISFECFFFLSRIYRELDIFHFDV